MIASSSPKCGIINPATTPSGAYSTYTAPSSISPGIDVSVTATSVYDSSKSNSATLIPVGFIPRYDVGVGTG
jgi:hypothetical protein